MCRRCRIRRCASLAGGGLSAARTVAFARGEASIQTRCASGYGLVSVMFALSSVGRAMDQLTPPVVRMISLTSVSAISLNFLGIFSLRDLGASMQQIIGKLNTICTMALSVGLLGPHRSPP